MIYKLEYEKLGNMRLVGHLDLMDVFGRACRRAGLALEHTQGFNPMPKLSLANPLSLGIASQSEYLQLETIEPLSPEDLVNRLNTELPIGLKVVKAFKSTAKPTIDTLIDRSLYEILIPPHVSSDEVDGAVKRIWASNEVMMMKKKKKGRHKIQVEVDVRPLILAIDYDVTASAVRCTLQSKQGSYLKVLDMAGILVKEILSLLDIDELRITRLQQLDSDGCPPLR